MPNYVGGIVGANRGTIKSCYVKADLRGSCYQNGSSNVLTQAWVGGICGANYKTVESCYNAGNISCWGYKNYVGGICGVQFSSTTKNCYNYGTGKLTEASSSPRYLYGGIIGRNGTYLNGIGTVTNCYTITSTPNLYHNPTSNSSMSYTPITDNRKSSDVLKTYANRVEGFSVLGDAFMPDQGINNGYPILIWEVPDWQFTEKNTCIAIGETIDIDVIDIGKNMLHKNQSSFSWTSSNTNIATVDSSGKVTGVAEGEVEIIAQYGNIELKTKVNVIDKKQENTDMITYIYTAKDLVDFKDNVNRGNNYADKTVQLMADIDLSTICGYKIGSWEPIGNETIYFTGTFEGNNCNINGMYINSTSSYQGVFGIISNAEINNIILDQGFINASNYAGGISGNATNSKIYGCNTNVIIKAHKSMMAGGIVATISNNTTVDKCVNRGNVYGSNSVGGITGRSTNSTITNSYNVGKIYCTGDYTNGNWIVGGIIGYVNSNGIENISNCYNIGNIYGNSENRSFVGGIIGYVGGKASITSCYSIGSLSDSDYKGGLVGNGASNVTFTGSYYLKTCGANGASGSNSTSYGKDETTLKGYAGTLGDAYISDITPNINNGYPILRWQIQEDI